MQALIDEILLVFESLVNPEVAEGQNAYMKHKFIHYGIKTPVRRQHTKFVFVELKNHDIEEILHFVELCFKQEKREFHQLGVDVLGHYCKKIPKGKLSFIKQIIQMNSWWDTVDMIAAKVLGRYFINFPEERLEMDKWINDDDLWIRRSAILFQLKYKDKTEEDRLFRYCKHCAHEKEFFIRKAIGWVLREYAKTNRPAVEHFVSQNENSLSNLSKREALLQR